MTVQQTLQKKQAGFSLVELLVVTTIIIVLTTIGVVSFSNAGVGARNSKRKADMEAVRQALVLRRSDGNTYPALSGASAFSTMTSTLISGDYMSPPAPTDPKGGTLVYSYFGTATSFCVCAPAEGTNQGNSTSAATGSSCSFGTGNYFCAESP